MISNKHLMLGLKFLLWSLLLDLFSNSHDSTLFIKCNDTCRIIIFLYIDDIIITGDDIDSILILKTELARQFEMKDLSYLRHF
jgi:hypothetical protein